MRMPLAAQALAAGTAATAMATYGSLVAAAWIEFRCGRRVVRRLQVATGGLLQLQHQVALTCHRCVSYLAASIPTRAVRPKP